MEHRLTASALRIGWVDRLLTAVSVAVLAFISGLYLSIASRVPAFITFPIALTIFTVLRVRRVRRAKQEMSRLSIRVDDEQLVFVDKKGRENVLTRSEVSRITRDETGQVHIHVSHQTIAFEFSERHFLAGSDLVDALERWRPVEDVPSRWVWIPPSSITGGLLALVLALVVLARDPVTISLGLIGLCVMTFLAVRFTLRQRLYPRASSTTGGA